MASAKLWLSFHHQGKEADRWALFLEAGSAADCDIWQVDGQKFEFEATHVHGVYPESAPNFREKWLIKDDLTEDEVDIIRDVADTHPVDNDAAFWDCRVYCFEILATLEAEHVLIRGDNKYRNTRRRLREKWRTDDGVTNQDSDEGTDGFEDDEVDMTRVADSEIDGESPADDNDNDNDDLEDGEPQDSYVESAKASRKRTLSHGTVKVPKSGIHVQAREECEDLKGEKRRKGE